MDPEGLCPIVLVFGEIRGPARTTISLTQLQRELAIDNATRAVEKEPGKGRIYFGPRHSGGPQWMEKEQEQRRLTVAAQFWYITLRQNRGKVHLRSLASPVRRSSHK